MTLTLPATTEFKGLFSFLMSVASSFQWLLTWATLCPSLFTSSASFTSSSATSKPCSWRGRFTRGDPRDPQRLPSKRFFFLLFYCSTTIPKRTWMFLRFVFGLDPPKHIWVPPDRQGKTPRFSVWAPNHSPGVINPGTSGQLTNSCRKERFGLCLSAKKGPNIQKIQKGGGTSFVHVPAKVCLLAALFFFFSPEHCSLKLNSVSGATWSWCWRAHMSLKGQDLHPVFW